MMPQSLRPSRCVAVLLLFLTALTVNSTQATDYILPAKAWKALRYNKAFSTKVAEQRLIDKIIWGLKSVVSRSSSLNRFAQGGGVLNVMKRRGGAVGRSAIFNRFLLAAVLNKDKMLPVGGQFNSLANPDHYTLFRYGRSI